MFNESQQIGDYKPIKRLSQGQQAEKIAFKAAATQSGKNKKIKSFTMSAVIIFLAIFLLVGVPIAGYVAYQADDVKKDFSRMSKQEMELLLEDTNPTFLKKMADDPEMKKQQIESIRQLLALASAAQKDPQIYDANTQKALVIIDAAIWAQTYDQEIHKGKDSTPFSSITETQVKAFYGEGSNLTSEQKQHIQEFDEFLKVQMEFARKNNSIPGDTEPTDEEKNELRVEFAKIKIYENEAKAKVKSGGLPEKFVRKVELQSKLQQAQFLSRMYSTDVLAKKMEVTDDDVQAYIAQHPELDKAKEQKAKALQVLQRLKNGEDFAALAKEFSDDPANKDKGGLYEGVTQGGGFDPKFEAAALALTPGQFTQDLVETPFGYHIIKLERKGSPKTRTDRSNNPTMFAISFSRR